MKKLKFLLLLLTLLLAGFHELSAQGCNASFSKNRWISILDSATIFTNYSSKDSTFNVHYLWTVDNVPISTSRNFSHTFPSIGYYVVGLSRIDSTNNCTDTFSERIRVTYQSSCRSRVTIKDTIDSCHAVLIFDNMDKRAIDSIVVNFGDGDSTTILSHKRIAHKYGENGYYHTYFTTYAGAGSCRTVNGENVRVSGCKGKMLCANRIGVSILADSTTRSDTVTYPDGRYRLWKSTTYLIKKDLDTLTAADSLVCKSCRSFGFKDLCEGSYYVKVALDSTDSFYQQFVPTYHGNVLRWDSVPKTINLFGVENSQYREIIMIKALNPGGRGFISGLVTQGANKKEGDPIGGIQIMAFNAKNEPVAYTYSRNDGRFFFKNLPMGKFYVYAEIPGVNILGNWITLTEDDSEVKDVKVEVTKNYVATTLPHPSQVLINPITFYPNPAQSTINISVAQYEGQILVSDISGRQFVQTHIEQNTVLDLEALESGAYIVSFVSESGLAFRKTLIKE